MTDLKASDFELYDKGKKLEIRVFGVESYHPTGADQSAAMPVPATLSTVIAHTFSNRRQAEPGAPNAPTVILIDAGETWDIHRMTWRDLVYARDQLIQFLRQVHPEDQIGIYLTGWDRFWILREYNQNCADLLERLASWKFTAGPDSASPKGLDAWTEFAMHFAGVDTETAKGIHHDQFWTHDAGRSSSLPEGFADAPGTSKANLALPVGLPEVHKGRPRTITEHTLRPIKTTL